MNHSSVRVLHVTVVVGEAGTVDEVNLFARIANRVITWASRATVSLVANFEHGSIFVC